ncbi:MAG: DUF4288 domain-containing protein [Pelobium sp.]
MNWFVAKMIFQIEGNDQTYPQFDEQLRLIDAINEELALEIAHQMGMMHQDEVQSSNQQILTWKFVAVTELQYIGDLEHGKEIHYRITEPEQTANYLEMVNEKATGLRKRKAA